MRPFDWSATHIRLVLLLIAVCAIAACGDDDKDDTDVPGGQAAASATVPTGQGSVPQAATTGRIGGTVSVLATWTGNEQEAFMAVVKPFEEQTGVKIEYEGTRDLNAILTTRV